MKINVRGDKVKVTSSIKDYIEVFSLIKVKGNDQTVEFTIPTKNFTLRAEETHSDLYAAIDLVIDKLERQIRKNKTRLNNKYKTLDIVDFHLDFEEKEENTKNIVKRKNIESKPMDEQEAILQMNLIDHDFYAFKNIEEECVSIIYKRKDNSYGIINVK